MYFNLIFLLIVQMNSNSVESWKMRWVPVSCLIGECCDPYHILADFNKLEKDLQERVYGQHLVQTVVNTLRSHYKYKSSKALALSFHGWPGGGKNYVSKFIAESIYQYGTKSKFVHHFIGRIHFPEESRVTQYSADIHRWLKSNITQCPRQLFIFDEVDKMPPQVLNSIKPMIDYRDVVDGVDYTQAVFIFLSNTGSALINRQYTEFWQSGRKREELHLADFENLIAKGVFNEEGGFHHSDTIKSNLIDFYIPFLPMEQTHVRLCILDEFKLRGVSRPRNEHIEEVLSFIEWGPDPQKIFSKTGCKRISSKVGLIVMQHYQPRQEL